SAGGDPPRFQGPAPAPRREHRSARAGPPSSDPNLDSLMMAVAPNVAAGPPGHHENINRGRRRGRPISAPDHDESIAHSETRRILRVAFTASFARRPQAPPGPSGRVFDRFFWKRR